MKTKVESVIKVSDRMKLVPIERKYTLEESDWTVQYMVFQETNRVPSIDMDEKCYVIRFRDCDLEDYDWVDDSGGFKRLNKGEPYNNLDECMVAIDEDIEYLVEAFEGKCG